MVKNLRKLKSISRTGQSDVVLEFAWGTDMDQASLDVRDKMEALQLPLEAKPPVLLRFNPSHRADHAPGAVGQGRAGNDAEAIRQLTELRRYADDDLKKKLETGRWRGRGQGRRWPGRRDPGRHRPAEAGRSCDLPIDNVISACKQENINVSGGRLEEGSQRYLVRTVNQFADRRRDPQHAGDHAQQRQRQQQRLDAGDARGRGQRDADASWRRCSRAEQRRSSSAAAPAACRAPEGRRRRAPGLQGTRGDHPPGRPRSGRAGDLQGRRRQHRGHRRCAAKRKLEDIQRQDSRRHRADHHRRPVASSSATPSATSRWTR